MASGALTAWVTLYYTSWVLLLFSLMARYFFWVRKVRWQLQARPRDAGIEVVPAVVGVSIKPQPVEFPYSTSFCLEPVL